VIRGRLGALGGVDVNGGSPATTAMTSDRWAAVRREQRLLNPQLILRDVAFRPRPASSGPTVTLRGRPTGSSSCATPWRPSASASMRAPGASTGSRPRTASTCAAASA
jgi:hypothetical protein